MIILNDFGGNSMFVGRLNEKAKITYEITRKETGLAPDAKQNGNPFSGETLEIFWMELMDDTLSVKVKLGGDFFVGALALRFEKNGTPRGITVRSADGARIIARYSGESGKEISESDPILTIAEELSEFTIDFEMGFTTLIVESIDIFGSDVEQMPLFPSPKKYHRCSGKLGIASLTTYTADCEDGKKAAIRFAEKFTELTGLECVSSDDAALKFTFDAAVPKNGYRLNVSSEGAQLSASDLRGFVYGSEVLIKLICVDGVSCGDIEDAPFMPFRGVHLYLPGPHEMEFARRLIKYVISPMGYNSVIIEVAGAMRFDSHPEINEAVQHALAMEKSGKWPPFPHGGVGGGRVVEKKDITAFCDYVRSFGIEVIPEVQTLGHVQFMTAAYPEIAEVAEYADKMDSEDLMLADASPVKFYPHCYCPSNEKSYEIAFDLLDEIIEVFRPTEFVHMGHDEVYEIGVCPKCREKDPAKLYFDDIMRYYSYLKKKGYRMMIWADMIQPTMKYTTAAALDMIPKDITLLDFIWYFRTNEDTEDNFSGKGFEIGMGNLYSSHYPRYEKRIRKPGMIGGQISTWVPTNEDDIAKEGKFYDMLYTAEMLWSDKYDSRLRYVYDRKIKSLMPDVRRSIRGEKPLGGDIKELYSYDGSLADAPCGEFEASVNTKCSALVLYHTAMKKRTRIPWVELDVIAEYEITYESGRTERLPVTYGGNICHYARRQNEPFYSRYYRHNGYCGTYFADGIESKTADGTPVTVYKLTWYNPCPDEAVKSVRLVTPEGEAGDVAVTGLSAIL